MRCVAQFTNDTQCTNTTIAGAKHCKLHHEKTISLYIKYKKLCKIADTLNIEQKFNNTEKQINHVMRCYILFNKAFNAREKHRKYSFVPEYHDSGHNYQFTKLKNQILRCEDILSKLQDIPVPFNILKEEKEKDDIKLEPITISQRIQKFQKKRQDCTEYIDQYIKDLEESREKKLFLVAEIIKCVRIIFGEPVHDDDKYEYIPYTEQPVSYRSLIMFDLAHSLENIGYFKGNFSKDRPYKFNLGSTSVTENILTIFEYFLYLSEDALKKGFEIMLFNKQKLIPFTDDIRAVVSELGKRLISAKLCLVWKEAEKRPLIMLNCAPSHMPFHKMKMSRTITFIDPYAS
jgi:hypothetical protein